jgi:molybdopterin/thiamine biosynthesis adenylyltransferase
MANSIFHHEEIYRGEDLVKRLGEVKIVVCGCGAIGSNLVDTLTRQGCSQIRVIDMDRVDTHNIGTQTYETADVGALKVNAMQNRVYNTVGIEIEAENKELKKGNVKKLLKGADLVIDGFDNRASRLLVQEHCRSAGLVCLHAGLHADYGEVVWDEEYTVPQDAEGDVCDYPLARNLIAVVVAITAEEVLDFILRPKPRKRSWRFTLGDLKIGSYR